jgi:hypothetical protein
MRWLDRKVQKGETAEKDRQGERKVGRRRKSDRFLYYLQKFRIENDRN